MKSFLLKNENKMLSLLEKLVNTDSGSKDKEGVDTVGQILKDEFERLGFITEVHEQQEVGNHLIFRHATARNPEIILIAHMDTVFSKGTAMKRPFSIKGNRAYGPGVMDMKGSHVTLLFAIQALIETGSHGIENLVILFNSDEEIGSKTSRNLIESHAIRKRYALIMEPARQDGSLVTARRGGGKYTLTIKGRAAHSGNEPEKGISAIEDLAHKIIKLQALNNHEEGVNVNVGLIEGGESVNTVASEAVAHIGIRMNKLKQAYELDQKIKEICETPDVEGITTYLEGGINRPPMVKKKSTMELLGFIQEVGQGLGISITDTATGGGSDASFTSALDIPTIDGLGPIGGNAHSEEEYLEIPSLVERSLLLAEVIRKLS